MIQDFFLRPAFGLLTLRMFAQPPSDRSRSRSASGTSLMLKPLPKARPALRTSYSGPGTSSTSWTSSSIPPAWVIHASQLKRTAALRQSIRDIGAQLTDLVFQNASPDLSMDWVRVPLECAVAAGNLSAVKRLLTAGVKTETPPPRLQPAPLLHLAAQSGKESVVKELLKAGVNVHEKDSSSDDRTALHCAAIAGNCAAVRVLTSARSRCRRVGRKWADPSPRRLYFRASRRCGVLAVEGSLRTKGVKGKTSGFTPGCHQ